MRLLTITAAVAVLSFSASASAAPVSFGATSEADRSESTSKNGSLFDAVIESTLTAFDFVFTAADKQDRDFIFRYYRENKTCDTKTQAKDETEAETEKKKALAGPEPIYFGF